MANRVEVMHTSVTHVPMNHRLQWSINRRQRNVTGTHWLHAFCSVVCSVEFAGAVDAAKASQPTAAPAARSDRQGTAMAA
jgi:hypothetical protein